MEIQEYIDKRLRKKRVDFLTDDEIKKLPLNISNLTIEERNDKRKILTDEKEYVFIPVKKVSYTFNTKVKNVDELIEKLIELKYSVKQELAIHRQKEKKPTEYEEYYRYVEECKAKAKEFVSEIKGGKSYV